MCIVCAFLTCLVYVSGCVYAEIHVCVQEYRTRVGEPELTYGSCVSMCACEMQQRNL